MVKNTIGGKKGKMLSKKQHVSNNSSFPVSMDEGEIYVCVVKVFGGGVFEVVDKDAVKYKAYLRGKMKGSNKRHNLVSMNSILLVGIRSDLSDKFSVDILFVYDNHHIQILSLNSHFPISLLSYLQGSSCSSNTAIGTDSQYTDSFVFSDEIFTKDQDLSLTLTLTNNTQLQLKSHSTSNSNESEMIDFALI